MGFLDGYRVLDLSDATGLLAGRILADLGADVVQAEPVGGSSARSSPPQGGGRSFLWDAFAANKRGVAYDPSAVSGRQLLGELVAAADVVIESAGPRAGATLGVDRDSAMLSHPALVWCSISAFGLDGPKADYEHTDLTVWAAGGPLGAHRDGSRPPLRTSIPQAYLHAGADAAAGVLLALASRARSGRGQHVDVSAQVSLSIATLGRILAAAWEGDATGATNRGSDLSGSGSASAPGLTKWRVSDGLVELNLAMGPAAGRFTNNLLSWMRHEAVELGRFGEWDWTRLPEDMEAGQIVEEDVGEFRALVTEFLADRTKLEVTEAAVEHKLLSVGVFDLADIGSSPQLADRNYFVALGEGDRQRTLPGPFVAVDRPAFEYRRPAPLVGEHTDEVRREWTASASARRPVASGPDGPPLEGLKVLDLSWVVAGPVIGRTLADFGATVVRVESSRRIETARVMPPFHDAEPDPEGSALYQTCNAGKLGLCLDLSRDEGRAVVRDLAEWADVMVDSFSPGTMQRWGLGYEDLQRVNPGLVVLTTTLCGQSGPWSGLAGYGNVGAALSGFQHLVGWEDRVPIGPYGPYTDYVGPRFSLVALLAALDDRRRTGQGCLLDVSQVEAGVWMLSPELADWFESGTIVERCGNADRVFAPHGVYPCRPGGDGSGWVAIAVRDDADFAALAACMDRPELAAQSRFEGAERRRVVSEELDEVISSWTSQLEAPDVERRLQAAGVPAHVAVISADWCEDPQIMHRGHLVRVPHERFGEVAVEGPRYRLSRTPGVVRAPAPMFHQHRRQVLQGLLGYSIDRMAELDELGVLV
ncbi:MAG: CoA transferase [Acidimicrobiales bacterium]